jgi:hypothetical protein
MLNTSSRIVAEKQQHLAAGPQAGEDLLDQRDEVVLQNLVRVIEAQHILAPKIPSRKQVQTAAQDVRV